MRPAPPTGQDGRQRPGLLSAPGETPAVRVSSGHPRHWLRYATIEVARSFQNNVPGRTLS